MRYPALWVVASFALAGAVRPAVTAAQDARDFVFTDDEGHLVLRFAGADPGGLNADQIEEIVNVQLSTMVHDRLRADALFEAEPVDSDWADSMTPRVEDHLRAAGSAFTAVDAECRSVSCRVVLEHASTWRVPEHQSLMGLAQRIVQAFVEVPIQRASSPSS